MTTPINHDFDDKQDAINWEDHVGLAHKSAEIACFVAPKFAPHFDTLVQDLTSKLWEIVNNGNYDGDVARFSTYAMTCLNRYWQRELQWHYFGKGGSVARGKDTRVISMNGTRVGKDLELQSVIGVSDECPSRRMDIKEIADDALQTMTEKSAQSVLLSRVHGKGCAAAGRALGISKQASRARNRRAYDSVRNLKDTDPALYDQYIDAIGGVAV